VQVILEECSRMRQLTDNLLNLARGEIPAIAVAQKRLDLARLTADVTRRFAIQAREKQVEIQEHIESVPEVIGDPVKLSWVISNLLGNALRYTPAGGTIQVSTLGAKQATRLEVTDSGPGIPPELKDYIFERFVQYGSDGLEKGSAGLGLSIVKEIVEAHGGRIFVESANSHGSRFIVEIPAAQEI
jgi:NtrC-family two-component system sensor histidine kinase KinB